MYFKIIHHDKQEEYYNKYQVSKVDLNIIINHNILVNDKEYKLRKRVIIENDYVIYFEPSRTDNYSNYKYQLLTHLEISNNKNTMIFISKLDLPVYIDNNVLSTESDYVFVNNKKTKYHQLENFDKVEILGFSLIYTDRFYLINNSKLKLQKYIPVIDNNLKKQKRKEIKINFREQYPKPIVNYHFKDFIIKDTGSEESIIISMLPSVTMALAASAAAFISAYNNYLNGRELNEVMVYMILPVSMLITALVVMPLQRHLQKKHKIKKNSESYNDYMNYLTEVRRTLDQKIDDYENYLEHRNYSFENLMSTTKIYNKQTYHNDYLILCVGSGTVETGFSFEYNIKDKIILNEVKKIETKYSKIEDSFIEINILDYKYISIVNHNNYFNYLLIQLITYYKRGCFNLIMLTDDNYLEDHGYLKYINQLTCNNYRLIATKQSDVSIIDNIIANTRKDNIVLVFNENLMKYLKINAHFIVITDSDNVIAESEVVIDAYKKEYYKDFQKYSFSYESGSITERLKELNYLEDFEINIADNNDNLFELYNFKSVNSINYQDYHNNLSAIIARKRNGDILNMDIHERSSGPHGLIAGTTGSGKTEFLISFLLSLAVCYPPNILQMVIIDFKGNTIESNLKFQNIKLPHLINSLSNIDNNAIERALLSFKNECRKRMLLFKRMSELTNQSSMNIDTYIHLFRKEYDLEPLAHLLIVIDEFAELKTNSDYFIKEIISLARIGRSLGIHLLLSTQKVSGVVNEEILANISYRICMKLNDIGESKLLIDSDKAYYLKEPGELYLYHNQQLDYGRGFMSSVSSDVKSLYENVIILDNMKNIISKGNFRKSEAMNQNEAIVRYLNNIYGNNKYHLWLKELKRQDYDYLENKYKVENKIIIGEYDDIENRLQGPLIYETDSNAVLFTSTAEDENNFINNIIYGCNKSDLNLIILDFCKNEYKAGTDCKGIKDISMKIKDIYAVFYYLEHNDLSTKTIVLIRNIHILYREYPDLADRLYSLLADIKNSNISFLLITENYQLINYRHLALIKNRYSLNISTEEELYDIYNNHISKYDEGIYYNGLYYNFKLCKSDKVKYLKAGTKTEIPKIPDCIEYENDDKFLLIGYSLTDYQKVYHDLSNELLICSYDNNLISFYNNLYQDTTKVIVKNVSDLDLSINNYKHILFLKAGISKLYQFNCNVDVKNDEEGIYINNNQKERVIYVNARLPEL